MGKVSKENSKKKWPLVETILNEYDAYHAEVEESTADYNVFVTTEALNIDMLMVVNWDYSKEFGENYLNLAKGKYTDKEGDTIQFYLYETVTARDLAVKIFYSLRYFLSKADYNDIKMRVDMFSELVTFSLGTLNDFAGCHCKAIMPKKATKTDDDLPF